MAHGIAYRRATFLPSLALVLAFHSSGQTPPPAAVAAHAEFEVASVKIVNHSVPPHGVGLNIRHGTLTMDAAALRQIIGLAYGIQRVRVEGGPDWLDHELYDIAAKAENPEATRDEIREMLQTLLTERFKLAFHRDTRNLPVYTLVVAKGGSKLQRAKEDEKTGVNFTAESGRLQLTLLKQSMAGLVNTLANRLNSPVLDQTGLTGLYDFRLEFAPDMPARPDGTTPMLNGVPVESGPSLFTALQEQLGLKLEEKKGPVEVMVIDHAEHPGEN
jgi:uncharacterized protein (TIGR03435 family)